MLHFATELRSHGFDTAIFVVDALPEKPHLFMSLLRERQIPLTSIGDHLHGRMLLIALTMFLPWAVKMKLRGERPQWSVLYRYVLERVGPRWLATQIRQDSPSVIHVHGRLPETFWPYLPLSRSVLHHGTEGRRDDTWDESEASAFSAFADGCAQNFVPGQGVAENLKREFGISAEMDTVYTICPDHDDAPLLAAETPARTGAHTVFGILCRMTQEKGIDTLLNALLIVRDVLGDVRFCFAGSGDLDDHIASFVEANALTGVHFVASFDTPLEVLRNIDVFVHPSISDAMPMAIAEAMMCGRPCIATAVGGIPELVRDGEEGIIVSPGNADELAQAMVTFANMSIDNRQAFSERVRARYETLCTANRVGATLAGLYKVVMTESERT